MRDGLERWIEAEGGRMGVLCITHEEEGEGGDEGVVSGGCCVVMGASDDGRGE